jgi:hypothetical protein
MEVNYQLTVDDFQQAIKASRKRNAFFRWSYRLSLGIVILALGTGVTLFAIDPHNSALRNSKVDWSAYVNWVEEKATFALFPHPRIFIVIPKRAFDADQLVEFRELLHRKVKQK